MKNRKIYRIDSGIQVLYVTITAISVLLTSISVGIAVYCLFFSSFVEQIGAVNLVASNFRVLTPTDVVYLFFISIALLMLSICIGLFFVVFTNRLFGPLQRIQSIFDAVRRGDYSVRVKVRKNDYLGEIADSFNQMLDSLEKKQS